MKHTIDPKIKIRKVEDLVEQPITVLVNQFTEDSANKFREDIVRAANTNSIKLIPIVIDSYGGQVYSLLSMLDSIASLKQEGYTIATIATGKAMSCGAILLCAGSEKYRYVSRHTTVMIHEVSSGGRGKVEEIKADAAETVRLNKLIMEIASTSIGKESNYLTSLIHEHNHADWYLNAFDCVKHNIANHIGYPMFNVDIKADISFK